MEPQDYFRSVDVRFFEEAYLDELPFGVLQLDRTGKVLNYNEYESGRAALPKRNVIGKNFFTEVAPCTDLIEFRVPYEDLVAQRKLRATFRYFFPFPDNPRQVTITLVYSQWNDTVWVMIVDDDIAGTARDFLNNYRPA